MCNCACQPCEQCSGARDQPCLSAARNVSYGSVGQNSTFFIQFCGSKLYLFHPVLPFSSSSVGLMCIFFIQLCGSELYIFHPVLWVKTIHFWSCAVGQNCSFFIQFCRSVTKLNTFHSVLWVKTAFFIGFCGSKLYFVHSVLWVKIYLFPSSSIAQNSTFSSSSLGQNYILFIQFFRSKYTFFHLVL